MHLVVTSGISGIEGQEELTSRATSRTRITKQIRLLHQLQSFGDFLKHRVKKDSELKSRLNVKEPSPTSPVVLGGTS